VSSVDLTQVTLLDLGPRQKKEAMTQVSVPEDVFANLKTLAVDRDCSVNQLVNSAILAYFDAGLGVV
jgi:hypothetical protein